MSWLWSWNFLLGSSIFAFGLYTNIRCDNILLNLRKPGETGYKIPHGFMFRYVSGGNYFGEVTEWFGWALACWSVPAFSFALFAAMFLGSRSYSHHRWYLKKFPEYPKNRKIIIPFILWWQEKHLCDSAIETFLRSSLCRVYNGVGVLDKTLEKRQKKKLKTTIRWMQIINLNE